MLQNLSCLCSQSYSYLLNYRIQSDMYNWFDENTEETQWLRLPGVGVWTASNLVTLATRATGVAEVFFKGSGILLSSPFTGEKIKNAKIGLSEIVIHTPKNFLRLIHVPIQFLGGTLGILIEPKHFTMFTAECMRVNLIHSKNNTLFTEQHKKDLRAVEGVVKPKFMAYQGRTWNRLHPDDLDDVNDY